MLLLFFKLNKKFTQFNNYHNIPNTFILIISHLNNAIYAISLLLMILFFCAFNHL